MDERPESLLKFQNLQEQYASINTKQSKICNIPLPVLEIPIFDDNKTKWREFWDFFQATIDHNNINQIQKILLSQGQDHWWSERDY